MTSHIITKSRIDDDITLHEASADGATVVSARDAACADCTGDLGIGKDDALHLSASTDFSEQTLIVIVAINADAIDGIAQPVEVAAEWPVIVTDGGVVVLGTVRDVSRNLKAQTLAVVGSGLGIPAGAVDTRSVHIHREVVEVRYAFDFVSTKALVDADAADGSRSKVYHRFFLDVIVAYGFIIRQIRSVKEKMLLVGGNTSFLLYLVLKAQKRIGRFHF